MKNWKRFNENEDDDFYKDMSDLGLIGKRVVILCTDDWEALYIDDKCEIQGHSIDDNDTLYLLRMAEKYNFTYRDAVVTWVKKKDEDDVYNSGRFPDKFSDLKDDYTKETS